MTPDATFDVPSRVSPMPEQFTDRRQQRVTATVGMWVFLANEILFFGTIFAGFYVMRLNHLADFVEGAKDLKWWIGGVNTAVLLVSSYVMAMAVHAAHNGDMQKVFRRLIFTASLGLLFLLFKAGEYAIDWHEQLVPILHYSRTAPDGTFRGQFVELFMWIYFVSTALHALHVFIGVVVLGVFAINTRRGHYDRDYHNPIDGVGLYWHFVDLVWIFLYPTLYLLRHM